MNPEGAFLRPEEDPDRTDKLPVLDEEGAAARYAGRDDRRESRGGWPQAEVGSVGLRQEIEQRDAAIAELTTLLRQKSFALSRAEKELDQVRAELMRAGQAAGREVADLERRLQDLERERVNIAALHDERRVAIAGLEDALSEAREREHHLEARIAELAAGQQAGAAAQARDPARPADTERQPLRTTPETVSADGGQAQIGELQDALEAARQELASMAAEPANRREAPAGWHDPAGELRAALAERDGRIEALLEKLRSREARRRYAADIRRAAARGADEDRDLLLARIAGLSADLAQRDERIGRLEAELHAMNSRPEGRGSLGALQPGAPRESPVTRYLTRIENGSEVTHPLSRPEVTIGRTPDNDLQVRETYISRHHAVIKLSPEAAIIEDAASRNGVFVNDRRVRRELLKDGDIVILGKARFRFSGHST
jgi:DNA repair exonuclease SbcCD ATPase subunit